MMVCQGIEVLNSTGIYDIIKYPTYCDYYFYAKILFAIFVILTFTLYNRERSRFLKADFISSMGVSALATFFIALAGTLIGMISSNIFVIVLVLTVVIIAIWFFKEDR